MATPIIIQQEIDNNGLPVALTGAAYQGRNGKIIVPLVTKVRDRTGWEGPINPDVVRHLSSHYPDSHGPEVFAFDTRNGELLNKAEDTDHGIAAQVFNRYFMTVLVMKPHFVGMLQGIDLFNNLTFTADALSKDGLSLSVLLYIINFLTLNCLVMGNCVVLAQVEMRKHADELGARAMGWLDTLYCMGCLSLSYFILVPMTIKEVVQNLHPRGDACGKIYYKKQHKREIAVTNQSESSIVCDSVWGFHQILPLMLIKSCGVTICQLYIICSTRNYSLLLQLSFKCFATCVLGYKWWNIRFHRKQHWDMAVLSWRETQGADAPIPAVAPPVPGPDASQAAWTRLCLWKGVYDKHFPFMKGLVPTKLYTNFMGGVVEEMNIFSSNFWSAENLSPSRRCFIFNLSVFLSLLFVNVALIIEYGRGAYHTEFLELLTGPFKALALSS